MILCPYRVGSYVTFRSASEARRQVPRAEGTGPCERYLPVFPAFEATPEESTTPVDRHMHDYRRVCSR